MTTKDKSTRRRWHENCWYMYARTAVHRTPVVTAAMIVLKDGSIAMGFAGCGADDQPCKKTGRSRAYRRMADIATSRPERGTDRHAFIIDRKNRPAVIPTLRAYLAQHAHWGEPKHGKVNESMLGKHCKTVVEKLIRRFEETKS